MAHSASHWLLGVGVGVMRNAKIHMPHDTNEKEKGERRRAASRRGGSPFDTFFACFVLFYTSIHRFGFLVVKIFSGWLAGRAGWLI